jgi:hypothetical protein
MIRPPKSSNTFFTGEQKPLEQGKDTIDGRWAFEISGHHTDFFMVLKNRRRNGREKNNSKCWRWISSTVFNTA